MLLYRLQKIALQLSPFRHWCMGFVLLGLALVVYALLDSQDPHAALLRFGLMLTSWLLLLFSFIHLFRTIPPPVLPKDSFMERARSKIRLGLYHLLALTVIIVGLFLLSMSMKLLVAR